MTPQVSVLTSATSDELGLARPPYLVSGSIMIHCSPIPACGVYLCVSVTVCVRVYVRESRAVRAASTSLIVDTAEAQWRRIRTRSERFVGSLVSHGSGEFADAQDSSDTGRPLLRRRRSPPAQQLPTPQLQSSDAAAGVHAGTSSSSSSTHAAASRPERLVLLTEPDGGHTEQHARFGSEPATTDVFKLTEVVGGGGGSAIDHAALASGARREQTAAEKLAVMALLVQKRMLKGTIEGISEVQMRLRVPGITASVFRDVLQLKVRAACTAACILWLAVCARTLARYCPRRCMQLDEVLTHVLMSRVTVLTDQDVEIVNAHNVGYVCVS
jgi:hypothetical protein